MVYYYPTYIVPKETVFEVFISKDTDSLITSSKTFIWRVLIHIHQTERKASGLILSYVIGHWELKPNIQLKGIMEQDFWSMFSDKLI